MPFDAVCSIKDTHNLRDHFDVLGFELCKNRGLPVEIAGSIIDHLNEQDLLAISRLSRDLNELANTVLYHDICIVSSSDSEPGTGSAALLLRTLLTRETAASHICHLALDGEPLQDWKKSEFRRLLKDRDNSPSDKQPVVKHIYFNLDNFKPAEFELYSRKLTHPPQASDISSTALLTLPRLCLNIITLATNLQHLYIDADYLRYPQFGTGLHNLILSGGLKSLRSADFCTDLIGDRRRMAKEARHLNDGLLSTLLSPAIDSCTTVTALDKAIPNNLRTSTVSRLCLTHYQLRPFDLHGLLAATPKLCHLEYNARVDYTWFSRLSGVERRLVSGLGPLFNALFHVKNTLTQLTATVVFDKDCLHFDGSYLTNYTKPLFNHGERILHKLKRLHTLSIPWVCLLGEIREKESVIHDWDKLLPSSLRHIVLTEQLSGWVRWIDWRVEDLMPIIASLLGWIEENNPTRQESPFALLLSSSQWLYSKQAHQKLAQLCEGQGMSCSIRIEKYTPGTGHCGEERTRHLLRVDMWLQRVGRPENV